ncbi:MAG TPA: hypothetical protein VGE52_08270 [Pirellulales bacterium]
MTTRLLATMLFLVTASPAWAAVNSGPKENEAVAALNVHTVVGESANATVDYAALRKEQPTVYVFVSAKEFDRPMFRFIKQINEDSKGSAQIVAVWLTDDADASKEYLPKISQYFEGAALTVFPEITGPEGWSINTDARVTVVVADKAKVVKSFGYQSVNETDAAEVVDALKKSAGK